MEVSSQLSSNVQLRDAEVINKTKQNFKTKIGKEYSAKDVIKVWDCISKWIETNLNRDKGILIKGIGYFTLAQWTINVGKGYPYTIRKPVFVIDEKLAKDYNLKRSRPYNTGSIHERYLNLLSVAQDFQLNSNMVTHCFKEVVTAFRKLLYEEKNCELPFPRIGKLQVKNKTVTLRFYQEFLERQVQHLKDRTGEERKQYQATSYNPDWDAYQYENQKRPCSAMSIINRPASSLSQYRPRTGYNSVLPDANDDDATTARPCTSLSDTRSRPDSRLSAQSRPGSSCSVLSRPGSSFSARSRPGSSHSTRCGRPGSGLSVQSRPSGSSHDARSRPGSRHSVQCRPGSSHDVVPSRPGSGHSARCRPESRRSVQCRPGSSHDVVRSRPESRHSVQCRPGSSRSGLSRPESRHSAQCRPDPCQSLCRPGSRRGTAQSDARTRPLSRSSVDCREYIAVEPAARPSPSCARQTVKSERTRNDSPVTAAVRPTTRRPTSKSTGDAADDGNNYGEVCKKTTTPKAGNDYDESLCCSCNIRKLRLNQADVYTRNVPSTDNKDNSMKGDNLLNTRLSTNEVDSKRKNLLKEISKYNYVIAIEKSDAINNEKTKRRNERNYGNSILDKRPTSNCSRIEKNMNFKHSLLNQIKCNKIKTESEKISSYKSEKLMQEELLKSLHDERMKNIEAKNRSKENYMILLNEHIKNKNQYAKEMKNKADTNVMQNSILGTNEGPGCANLYKNKNRELASFQLKQKSARNQVDREEREKNICFERGLLNQLKEEDENLRRKIVQKRLNERKFLTEDLATTETERCKNRIPGAYPMNFPLQKMAKRCRLCKKNGLLFPVDKITDLPC